MKASCHLNVIDTAFQNVASFDDTMVEAVSDETRKSLENTKHRQLKLVLKCRLSNRIWFTQVVNR